MCTFCSSGDVQTKFYLLPRFLNHVSCYSFNGWHDPFLQVLDIPIFSAYTMFLMYPHRKKSSGERPGLRGGQGIGPFLPIQASGNLSFKTSVTKQLKWEGAPYCIKITLLTVSCSKVSICGNTYCSSKSRWTTPVMVLSLNVTGDRISFGRLQSYKGAHIEMY